MSETTTTTTESNVAARRHAGRTAMGEGQAYWFFGALAVVRSPEGALPIVIEMAVPPGGHTPLHVHTTLDDSFYLLSGRMAMRSGDETFVAYAGDYVCQPAGVPQTFFALDFDYLYKVAAETGQPVLGPPMTQEEAAGIAASAGR